MCIRDRIQGVIAEQLADENFSIDTLSEQMNMSRSNFYRKIKALSGMSPNEMCIRDRDDEAGYG